MNKCLAVIALLLVTLSAPALGVTRTDVQNLDKAGQYVKSKNYKEAYSRFKTMGDQGCPFSNCLLGIMSQQGRGVNQNIPRAITYYKKSANKGFRDAELHLGRLYDSGADGLERNASMAAQWFQRAAQHGIAEAQFKLGKMYLNGDGVKEQSFKAKIWLRKAADQGVTEASELLSKIPGETAAQQQVQDKLAQAGGGYGEGLMNIEKSWQGYVDIVNQLEKANATVQQ